MRYDFRPPVARASLVASRPLTRLTVSFARSPATVGCRTPGLVQPVDPSGYLSGSRSDLPSSHGTLAPAFSGRLTPAPCSQTPVEPSALILSRRRCCPRTLERRGLRPCVNFGALLHGSVLAVHASGRRHRRLRNTRFRRVIGPYRSRFRGMGSFRSVSSIVPDIFPLSWASLGAIQV